MSCTSVEELERAIRHLPAIFAVRVFRENNDGIIDKVHVLADPSRSPKKVVRDIETLLLLKFDLRIDYRKISLVQLRPEDLSSFMRPRVKLSAVDKSLEKGSLRVCVVLEGDERVNVGMAEGPTDTDIVVLATQATLDALRPVVAEAWIKLNTAQTIPIEDEVAVFVSLTAILDQSEEKLLGSCFIQNDPVAAAVRATLDAVNRRFFSA